MLLRHRDGRYYLRQADGLLSTINESDVTGAIDAILGRYRTVDTETHGDEDDEFDPGYGGYSYRVRSGTATLAADEPKFDRLGRSIARALPPGSYLALTTSAPGFDSLGLDVRYERETHVVFGILAAEEVDD